MLGFDLGSHELKIASWDGNSISSCIAVEMPDNLVNAGSVISYDALADFIKETVKSNGIRGKDSAVILPSGNVYLRRTVIPFMDDAQLAVNLPYEFKDFLTMDKTRYYYAYTINSTENDEEGKPVQMDLTAAAVAKTTIEDYRTMFRRAGLRLKYAIPAEIAFSNLLRQHGGEETEYCILDLGHASTTLDIFTGSVFETTRTMDYGLVDVDVRIADEFGVDRHIAHTYKESNYRGCLNITAAESIYHAISADARKAINFYGLSNRDSNIEKVYLAGGGSCLQTLETILGEDLGMQIGKIAELLPPVVGEPENASKFAAAIGAALADGFNLAQKEKSQFRPQLMIPLLLAVLALVGLFAKFAVYDRYQKLNDAQGRLSQLKSEEAALLSSMADYDDVQQEYNKYSVGWMTDDEKALVFKSDMLKLMEEELAPGGRITEIASSGNVLTCKIAGITLDETSSIVNKLYERGDVLNVAVSSAQSEETPYVTTVVDEAGEEVEQSTIGSLVSISVTMAKTEEGGQN